MHEVSVREDLDEELQEYYFPSCTSVHVMETSCELRHPPREEHFRQRDSVLPRGFTGKLFKVHAQTTNR